MFLKKKKITKDISYDLQQFLLLLSRTPSNKLVISKVKETKEN